MISSHFVFDKLLENPAWYWRTRHCGVRTGIIWIDRCRMVPDIVAPCFSDAPASDSSSGFVPGRATTERSGLNGVLGPRAPWDPVKSGVRSNANGSSLSMVPRCSMVRIGTRLSRVYPHNSYNYVQKRIMMHLQNTVKSLLLSTHYLQSARRSLVTLMTSNRNREREREHLALAFYRPQLSRLPQ